jgi:hypothetical protein
MDEGFRIAGLMASYLGSGRSHAIGCMQEWRRARRRQANTWIKRGWASSFKEVRGGLPEQISEFVSQGLGDVRGDLCGSGLEWPGRIWMMRMSTPGLSRCVANRYAT